MVHDDNVGLITGFKIFCTFQQTCYKISVGGEEVARKEVTTLACLHAETDTRIMYHLHNILDVQPLANISVRSTGSSDFLYIKITVTAQLTFSGDILFIFYELPSGFLSNHHGYFEFSHYIPGMNYRHIVDVR